MSRTRFPCHPGIKYGSCYGYWLDHLPLSVTMRGHLSKVTSPDAIVDKSSYVPMAGHSLAMKR